MSMNTSSNVSRPLIEDMLLDGEEIWTRSGKRCGFNTVFIASQRKVIYKKWVYDPDSGTDNTEEELSIPDHITSEEELLHFIDRHNHSWLGARKRY